MKNIILLTIDCLRADHLSCMGYPKKTTPFIDRLAEKGLLFSKAISVAPTTRYSFPAILGSIYPLSCKDLDKPFQYSKSLAEVLQEKGYSTGAFHSNIVISRRYNYDAGFEMFYDNITLNKKIAKATRKINKKVNISKFINIAKRLMLIFKSDKIKISGETINKKAINWIKDKDPFFLWLHYMDVHGPYIPPKKYRNLISKKKYKKREMADIWLNIVKNMKNANQIDPEMLKKAIDLYDGGIRYVDTCVEQLVEALRKQNKLHNTIIIITADHGEEFGEHSGLAHLEKLYDELIQVPLIIFNAEKQNTKNKSKDLVSLIDLAPTILDLLKIPIPQEYAGQSLFKVKNQGVISEVYNEKEKISKTCIRTKKWKLIYTEKLEKYELYDLENDPKEQKNVYIINQSIVKEFKNAIQAHIAKNKNEKQAKHKTNVSKVIKNIKI